LEWQRDDEDWFAKNADFAILIGSHGNVPEGSQNNIYQVNKPLHPSTNPEILVKRNL